MKSIKILSTIIFISIFFNACVKTDPLIDNTQGGSNLSKWEKIDTAYGTLPLQKLDFYLPASRTSATKLVVIIHGGGWESGDKSELNIFVNLLKAKWPQAAIANINYRLTADPLIHHTEIMNDIQSAINFIISNKTKFSISDTLMMIGHSAGAHLALLYTYKFNTNNYVKAVADFSGPSNLYDLEWYNSTNYFVGPTPVKVSDVFTRYNGAAWDTTLYKSNSPFWVATSSSRPTIIFHGSAFTELVVPIYQSQEMANKLSTLGVPFEYHEYFDGHVFTPENYSSAFDQMIPFFKNHLK